MKVPHLKTAIRHHHQMLLQETTWPYEFVVSHMW